MKRIIHVGMLLLTLCLASTGLAKTIVTGLTCEYKTNPVGIDAMQPRFGWIIESTDRDVMQSAWQIQVSTDPQTFEKNSIWDSGKQESDQSNQIVYKGPVPQSATRYFWRVKVWDQNAKATKWSEPAYWEMGLLQPSDWTAEWIQPNLEEDNSISNPSPVLRREFALAKEIKSARAWVTSLGLYELYINGSRVGDQVLTPGWTSYHTRLQYQTYDVTNLLVKGENAVGAMLGDGWYRGNMAWNDNRNLWGEKLALLMQITVEYSDGTTGTITTDTDWTCSTGPVRTSDIYNGETYDARLEMDGWTKPGYNDSEWAGVTPIDHSKTILIAPAGPPVKRVEKITPIAKIVTPEGDLVFDMGQNMVGWIRFTVKGPVGSTVKIRHAEVLDKDGNFYTENLRTAKQLIQYTLKGDGEETFEPHFTFQGFRYIAIDSWPGEPDISNITGVVVHSDIGITGDFRCSNPMLNQLQHNIQWGQKGNFVDVPTDCPQRDERLGWTGDAQAFAPTACFNANVAGFYTKWLGDFIPDQKNNGSIPAVIPDVLDINNPDEGGGQCGWADAVAIVPWAVYQYYGDTRLLEQMYQTIANWINYMHGRAGDDLIWTGDYHYGDWLSYNTTNSDYPGAYTDRDFLATAYFANTTQLMAKIAGVLGKTSDQAKYESLYNDIKAAFVDEFLTDNGRLSPNTQTAYSVALTFGLIPENLEKAAATRLANDVNHFGHITTGFLGTPLIMHVLSKYGYWEEAYKLLNRDEYPSWLYPVTKGATTIWERWDGIKPDGTFQDKGMNSYNHYAYGAIGDWMYSAVAGLKLDSQNPGFKHIMIAPHPGGGLENASAWHQSLYGKIVSGWEKSDDGMTVTVQIPANTTATVCLPNAQLEAVLENGKGLSKAKGVHSSEQSGDNVKINLGSGQYQFTYPL